MWLTVLGSHLADEPLAAFKAMTDKRSSYKEAVKKLIKYDDNTKHVRKSQHKKRFEGANLESNEKLYLFSNRLEKLFRVAYPGKDVDTSSILRKKFLKEIPKSLQKLLKFKEMELKEKGKKIKWGRAKWWQR